jgi:uncharacterized protein
MREGLINGRVLVTGATGGLGQAISRAFAQSGARLVLSGRRAELLNPLADELSAQTIVADLADRRDVEQLADTAGEVDVLIANAALPASGRFTSLSQAQIDTMLEVNLRSQIALARFLLPGMLERRRGHLVFISSLSGKAAGPVSSMYSATKFGLRGFALGLREDLRGSGVGASVILPGFISDAGMFADSGAKLPPGVGTRTPAELAAAVLNAISHDRAEVSVAPFPLRVGANVATVAPQLSARVQHLLGGSRVANRLADSQVKKRPRP